MLRILLPAALLLAGSIGLFAQEPRPKAVQKVYAVAELVVPHGDKPCGEEEASCPICPAQAQLLVPTKTCEDKLIKTITSTVRPHCWASAGGCCSIEYYPIGMGLVVHAPDDVQKEVTELLARLRRQQDASIAVTLRVLTVSDDFFQRFGLDFDLAAARCCPNGKTICTTGNDGLQRIGCHFDGDECCEKNCCPPAPATGLTDQQVQMLLAAIQGDRRACVTCAPRITLPNGQLGTVCMEDRQKFVTGAKIKVVNDQETIVPEHTEHSTGLNMSVLGTISADLKHVGLNLKATHTYLENAQVPLFPVTHIVTPKFEGGTVGQPIPFTQFIQQPKFKTLKLDTHLDIPAGGTMLVYGGQVERIERQERSMPVLSKIPYVNRLFKNVGYARTCDHLLVMVTPQVINGECAQAPCPPCQVAKACGEEQASAPQQPAPMPSKPVAEHRVASVAAKLVAKYHEACAKGEMEQAREFAQMALDLDPACFSKPYAVAVAPASAPVMPIATSVAPAACSQPTPMSDRVIQAIHEDMDRRLPARFVIPPELVAPSSCEMTDQQSRQQWQLLGKDQPLRPASGMTHPFGHYLENKLKYLNLAPETQQPRGALPAPRLHR